MIYRIYDYPIHPAFAIVLNVSTLFDVVTGSTGSVACFEEGVTEHETIVKRKIII